LHGKWEEKVKKKHPTRRELCVEKNRKRKGIGRLQRHGKFARSRGQEKPSRLDGRRKEAGNLC